MSLYSANWLVSTLKATRLTATTATTIPELIGLNFDEKDALVIERNQRNDTIHYWVKDSLLYKQDTLAMSIKYLYTDTLNQLVPRTDTLRLVTKNAKKQPQPKKGKKSKTEETDSIPTVFLDIQTKASSSMNVYDYVSFIFPEPVDTIDVSAIHLNMKVDTLWQEVPFTLLNLQRVNPKSYQIMYSS